MKRKEFAPGFSVICEDKLENTHCVKLGACIL